MRDDTRQTIESRVAIRAGYIYRAALNYPLTLGPESKLSQLSVFYSVTSVIS